MGVLISSLGIFIFNMDGFLGATLDASLTEPTIFLPTWLIIYYSNIVTGTDFLTVYAEIASFFQKIGQWYLCGQQPFYT